MSTEIIRSRRDAMATVVLSAGASRRWGGRPKALLPIGSETALERVVRLSREVGIDRVGAVVGRHAAEVGPLVPREADVIANPEWARGRTGSVQAGLSWAGAADGILLWPVDHPFVAARTVERILAASESDPLALWTLPSLGERGGHPIVIRRSAFAAVLAMAPDAPLRAMLPHLGVQVRRVPVDDPAVLDGTDTPDEYRAGLEAWRSRGEAGWNGD